MHSKTEPLAWEVRGGMWAYGPVMRIIHSGERKGMFYASSGGGEYSYHTTLEEAKAWIEAMYALGGQSG